MHDSEPSPNPGQPGSIPRPPSRHRISDKTATLAVLFGISLVAAAALYRPWNTPAIGFDSTASVLFFDRLAAHQTLEAFVGSTPKPLMTLVYGLAFNLFHDWRLVSVVATVEFAAMVVAVAALAWRTSGPVAAGAAAFGLLGCELLLLDGALTYANPWAILFWALAGLALTESSPRFGLAGVALFLATLMRAETIIILALAAVVLVAWRLLPRRCIPGGLRPPMRSTLLLVGFLALPVMVLHDWLLTSNGFFWLDVSAIASRADPSSVETPLQVARDLARHYAEAWPLALPAVVAVIDLVRRRRYVVLLGLVACGPGVIAFLEVLAVRNVYVSYRYTIPADATLILTAALGADAIVRFLAGLARRRGAFGGRRRDRLAVVVAAVAIGAVISAALVRPYGLDSATLATIDGYRTLQTNYERLLPTITAAEAALPDRPTWALADNQHYFTGPPPRLYVPPLLSARIAIDLGLPVWAVRAGPLRGDPSVLQVALPAIAYIDARQGGDPPDQDRPFEVDRTTRVGRVIVEPIVALPGEGLWVVKLSPAAD
jgi:hypothetical protein